jgi:hypothetical protein
MNPQTVRLHVDPVPGSYRIATDGLSFRIERYITKAIWPLTSRDGWKAISMPCGRKEAEEKLRSLRDEQLSESKIWRPIES